MGKHEIGEKAFKYKSLADSGLVAHARDIIVNHRLYYSLPEDLNDPQECRARISFDAQQSVKIKRTAKRIRKEDPTVSKIDAMANAPARIEALESQDPETIRLRLVEGVGVASLSRSGTNLRLWEEYADNHKGICIEFCAQRLADVMFFVEVRRVDYVKAMPIVNFYADNTWMQIRKLLLTKLEKPWKREGESRMVTRNRLNHSPYFPFHRSLIRAVHLGYEISDPNKTLVRSWLDEIPTEVRPLLQQAAKPPASLSPL